MSMLCNLVFMTRGDEILLAMKKRGFGANNWNGYGGKVLEGESIEEAALREIKEESGVTANSLVPRGKLDFHFPDGLHVEVHLYSCTDFTGEAIETEEMRPQWFKTSEVPLDQMWDDDRYWLPQFLAGQDITAVFNFDENKKVASYKLNDGQEIKLK